MRLPSIGELRHRLTLETPAAAPDGAGGSVVTWSAVAELWAAVVPISSSEVFEADGVTANARYRVTVRTGQAITPVQRFRLGTRIFHILGMRDHGSPVSYLICECEERDL